MTPGAHAEVCGSSPILVKHGTPILPAVPASNVEPSLLMPSSPTSNQAPNYVCHSSEKSSDPFTSLLTTGLPHFLSGLTQSLLTGPHNP